MKPLKDGEFRRMQRGLQGSHDVHVHAYRQSSDSPYVNLVLGDGTSLYLSDVEALELIARIKRALSILPSSK